MLIFEQDMVRVDKDKLEPGTKLFSIPATRIAEELGKRMVLNIVMVGYFAAVGGLLKAESLRQAVADSVPPSFKELNLRAFYQGFEYGIAKQSGLSAEAMRPAQAIAATETT
jgi:2-oxoglutarate ferredoxin oxidoreductase subunit gamma